MLKFSFLRLSICFRNKSMRKYSGWLEAREQKGVCVGKPIV